MKKPHIQWPEQWLRRKRIPSIGFSYSGKDFIISMSLYTLSVVLCLILRGASQDGDTGYVYMIFLLDVFLTALLTEGFFFSLIISIFCRAQRGLHLHPALLERQLHSVGIPVDLSGDHDHFRCDRHRYQPGQADG